MVEQKLANNARMGVENIFLGGFRMENLKTFIDCTSGVVAVIALCFSVYCLRFTRVTISASYQSEITAWFGRCISVMMKKGAKIEFTMLNL